MRLLLARSGAMAIEVTPLPASRRPSRSRSRWRRCRSSPDDFRLRHKTSDRAFYDEARAAAGTFEVVFTDPDGFLTEGSFTNLFVERGGDAADPASVARPAARSAARAADRGGTRGRRPICASRIWQDGFLIGNAVRGLMRATRPAIG